MTELLKSLKEQGMAIQELKSCYENMLKAMEDYLDEQQVSYMKLMEKLK